MATGKKPYYSMSTLDKVFRILDILADKGPLTVSQVAKIMDLPRSGSHRFLANLKEQGYVTQNADATYQLSLKLFQLGMKIVGKLEIRQLARPYLQELVDLYSETVILACLEGHEAVYLDKIQSKQTLRANLELGTRVPVHCTSVGKVMTAFLSEEKRSAVLDATDFQAFTPHTITDRSTLEEEFKLVRENGFSLCHQEYHIGIMAIAAPVFSYEEDRVYSMSISGPTQRMSEEQLLATREDLLGAAARLSEQLGNISV